jgi:hypothetical protein
VNQQKEVALRYLDSDSLFRSKRLGRFLSQIFECLCLVSFGPRAGKGDLLADQTYLDVFQSLDCSELSYLERVWCLSIIFLFVGSHARVATPFRPPIEYSDRQVASGTPGIRPPFETPPFFLVVGQGHLKLARERRLVFQHSEPRVYARIRVHKDGGYGSP